MDFRAASSFAGKAETRFECGLETFFSLAGRAFLGRCGFLRAERQRESERST